MKFDPNLLENLNTNSPAGSLFQLVVEYRQWLLFPTLVCTLVAIAVAVLSRDQYSSRQTLVVRDDMVGSAFKPGRFESMESMKSAQETILEMARRPQVIRSALSKLGPPRGQQENWIDDEVIESTQERIKISAPNGAEFGATEAIVLAVEQHTRERSRKFISLLLDEIEHSLREFRSSRFSSMQQELAEAAKIANESYARAADNLKRFEAELGPDLGTLISLVDQQSGSLNNLQDEVSTLMIEQRNAQSDVDTVCKQIQILKEVSNNPSQILELPAELFQLLPTLDSLAKGLNDALLKYSISVGKYSNRHPNVKADLRAVETVKMQVKQKLSNSLAALEFQEELQQKKLERINDLIAANRKRLSDLSRMRVDYKTLRTEVLKKAEVKGKASEKLADIQTLGAAAGEINLFTRVDEPQVDVHPAGPSGKMIVAGGMLSGLFIGIGLAMLVAPINNGKPADDWSTENPIPPGNTKSTIPQSNSSEFTFPTQSETANGNDPDLNPSYAETAAIVPEPTGNEQRKSPTLPTVAGAAVKARDDVSTTESKPPIATSPSASATSTAVNVVKSKVSVGSSKSSARDTLPSRSFKKDSEFGVSEVPKPGLDESIFKELGDSESTGKLNPTPSPKPAVPRARSAAASSNLSIAEKIHQLEKAEIQSDSADRSKGSPMNTGVPNEQHSAAVVAGTTNKLGTPHQTSNPTSAASASGNESAPRGEIKPDARPAASKVNLNQLREQIKAKRAGRPDVVKTTLEQADAASDIPKPVDLNQPGQGQGSNRGKTTPGGESPPQQALDNNTIVLPDRQFTGGSSTSQLPPQNLHSSINVNMQSPSTPPASSATQPPLNVPKVVTDQNRDDNRGHEETLVDKHISDLANSIRDICKPGETPKNPPAKDQ